MDQLTLQEFFRDFFLDDKKVFYSAMLLLIVAQELIVRVALSRVKGEYRKESEKMTDPRAIEEATLQYHGKRQRITVFRIVTIALILLMVAAYADVRNALTAVVPLAAVTVAFKESIVSFFTYFYILAHFRIGDDIRIGDTFGEILSIQPTRTLIQTKDTDGEFTGRATEIPNYLFATQPVSKQEAKVDTHRLVLLDIPLTDSTLDFGDLIKKFRAFLDELLPIRTTRNVGHFRSYAGVRYKLDSGYNSDKGHIILRLSFISHPSNIALRKEEVISFVEAARKGKDYKAPSIQKQSVKPAKRH